MQERISSEIFIHVRRNSSLCLCAHNDYLTGDSSRVCLQQVPGKIGSDYINASFITVSKNNYLEMKCHILLQGHDGKQKPYVAAQGKLKHASQK